MNSNQTIAQFLNIQTFPFEIKNENGKVIYRETSYGAWFKREFDPNGNVIYWETSYGAWIKREFDLNGNVIIGKRIYYEDSNGTIYDDRPKVEITLEEIAQWKGVDVSQIRIKE
jgi:hypothetical protein